MERWQQKREGVGESKQRTYLRNRGGGGGQVTPELRGTETAGTGEGWWLTPNMADSSKNINTGKICPELKTLMKGNQK